MRPTVKKFRASFGASFILLLVLLGVAGHASMAIAQSPGTFTATGEMTTARCQHTATLLPNGKVLIVGGVHTIGADERSLASAEVYDPVTGNFTPTGNMTVPRAFHTATLLPDGRVLIAGGLWTEQLHGTFLASAEVYDPSTGTFTVTANMVTAQAGHRATLLSNGKVLIVGGRSACCSSPHFANPELYDPSTGTFTATGTYATANPKGDGDDDLFATTATLLADGRVLMLWGGSPAELYDPGAGTFSPTSTPTISRGSSYTATLLTNGRVLVAGSWFPGPAEVYDPSTGTFTATGFMTVARGGPTATLLPDGNVLIAGGISAGGSLASADVYDSSMGAFAPTGDMLAHRRLGTATLLNDGKVLITGGFSTGGFSFENLSSAELYNPPLLVPAPALFSLSGDGLGQGAILHASTNRVASSSDPATVGEALEIYCSGFADGSVIPPQVAIGGRMAEVLFFGKAPGFAGVNQVNVRVPGGVALGDAVPVRLDYIGRPSNEVTIGVR